MTTRTAERRAGEHKPGEISSNPDMITETTYVFARARIIPSVVDKVTAEVDMSMFLGDKQVMNAEEVSPDDLVAEPRITLSGHSHSDIFTLLMVDPDMPSPYKPDMKDTLCWMLANIKGGDFEHADCLVGWMAPEPSTMNGQHRYVFLLFKHLDNTFRQFEPPAKRANFQTKEWAKQHALGDPVSALYVVSGKK